MILPNYKRLNKSDYPKEFQALIDKMSFVVNDGFNPVYLALAGRLSIGDNMLTAVKQVTLQVNESGIPLSPTKFSLAETKVTTVQMCMVGRAVNNTNSAIYPTSGVMVSFTPGVGSVTIDHVTGLVPGYQWTLTVVAFG